MKNSKERKRNKRLFPIKRRVLFGVSKRGNFWTILERVSDIQIGDYRGRSAPRVVSATRKRSCSRSFWNGNETNLRRRAVDFVLALFATSVTSHRRRPADTERRSRLVIISTTKYSRETIFFLLLSFFLFNWHLIHSVERMEFFFERNNDSRNVRFSRERCLMRVIKPRGIGSTSVLRLRTTGGVVDAIT